MLKLFTSRDEMYTPGEVSGYQILQILTFHIALVFTNLNFQESQEKTALAVERMAGPRFLR